MHLLTLLGSKAHLSKGTIHRGVLLIEPSTFTFYDGSVNELNAVGPEDRIRKKLLERLNLTLEQYLSIFKPIKQDTKAKLATNTIVPIDDDEYFDQMDDDLISQVVKDEFDHDFEDDFDSIDPDNYLNMSNDQFSNKRIKTESNDWSNR